jgi:hypothetical protein
MSAPRHATGGAKSPARVDSRFFGDRSFRGFMKTPRSALRLAAAVALAMAVFPAASPVTAQEQATPFGAISCSSNFGNPVLLDKKSFHLVAAPAAEIASLQKTKPAISMRPFAAGKLPYEQVEIYLAEKDLGDNDPEESAVSLYVRAVRNQKESWFTIAHDREDIPNLDFFTRTKGDTGSESGIDKEDDSGPAVSLALKNNNVPIFEVSWWRREVGASTEAAVQKIILLDFRALRPSVLSALQCIAAEGGGVCGVYDNGTAPTTALSCDWDAAKSDFLCTSSETGDFTPPVTHRVYLASGADAPYTVKEGEPPNLNAVAAWSTYNALPHKTPDVQGLGAVTILGRYAPTGARETAVLLASRSNNSFEPRYFGVVVDTHGPSAAFEILPQPLVDERLSVLTSEVPSAPDTRGYVIPAVINAADKFADDDAPSFQVALLESFSNVSLWQVTAKQGTLHEVVWLAAGFNSGTGRYVFSAVRIASEFGTYAACGSTRSEPFAASIERKKGTLGAILDVEPAHEYDVDRKRVDSGDQGQHTTPCPVQLRMFWNPSVGFVREETDADCPATVSARNLTITDAGVITMKPDDSPGQ